MYTDLLAQDKEESTLKRLKSDGLDKDGLKEASVRKKFKGTFHVVSYLLFFSCQLEFYLLTYTYAHYSYKGVLQNYGLLQYFEEDAVPQKIHKTDLDPSDNHINKSIFKDKKLSKLWEKAEKSGFDQKELKTLKEEFQHYQDKVDEYYALLETLNNDDKNSKLP